MTSVRWFVLDLNPEPWAVGPVGVKRAAGRLSAYVGRNQQLDAYKEAVRDELGSDHQMLTGKIKLKFYFWRNRAEYETPGQRAHRKHEVDVTNLQKATEDALQTILFKNDKDVVDIQSVMVEQGPDVRGRIVIRVEAAADMPDAVFDLPQDIWEIMERLDEQPSGTVTDRNAWGAEEDVF